eukprot:m.228487 g.228487  ORF g.228487 m.228487 type:complete len:117 (-) comp15979_c0_seq8:2720-3070(-)
MSHSAIQSFMIFCGRVGHIKGSKERTRGYSKRELEHDKPQLVADRPKAVDDNSEVKKCPAALGRLDTMGIMSEVMSQCLIAKVKSVLQKVEGDETAQDKGLREKKQIERHMLIDIT